MSDATHGRPDRRQRPDEPVSDPDRNADHRVRGVPATPPGWEDASERLVRLVDPEGRAAAWVCPALGANTVAYAARLGDRWVQVLDVPTPEALHVTPSRFGLPILFPFPGHLRDRRYRWAGREYAVPPTYPGGSGVVHGFAHVRSWRLLRAPGARVECELRAPDDLTPEQAASYPYTVRVVLEVWLEEARLVAQLTATNEGDAPAPVALGLHPYFSADVLGPDRSRVRVELPGRAERILTATPPPIPTGERRPAQPEPIAVVPLGQTMLAARTDFPPHPQTARLTGLPPLDGRAGWTVTLTMTGAYRDVLLFAPPAQPSVSIEPHTHAPGAASMPEGHPDGLIGLAPGQTLAARATIGLAPPPAGR